MSFVSPAVNRVARHTLGIYIIHQVPVFIPVMWGIFRVGAWVESLWFPALGTGVILAVFCGCFLMDCVGSALTARLLRMPWLEHAAQRIDRLMNDETEPPPTP